VSCSVGLFLLRRDVIQCRSIWPLHVWIPQRNHVKSSWPVPPNTPPSRLSHAYSTCSNVGGTRIDWSIGKTYWDFHRFFAGRLLIWHLDNNKHITALFTSNLTTGSPGSAVGIATGYGLDDRGVVVKVPVWSRMFTTPYSSDWNWVPPSLLYSGYWGLFQRGLSGWDVKLTTHLKIVTRSRNRGSIHSLLHTYSWRTA
jgi:hypothetical protein